MRKALVLGANGQDGSYLCEILCDRGFDVFGVGRQKEPRWPVTSGSYRYHDCDVADPEAMATLLNEVIPDFVFHFAAIHGAAGFNYEAVWRQAHQVNTLSVHAVLEFIRTQNPNCNLLYASSAKVFGDPLPARIDENSPRLSTDPYSITKNTAHTLIEFYRKRHGAKASVFYMFNHESPRRSSQYFIPKIAQALRTARSKGEKSEVHTLNFCGDWGDAREYMEIAADMVERGVGEDYVLATGRTWTGREVATEIFSRHGLNYADHLIESVVGSKPPRFFSASNAKLVAKLGRKPQRCILDVLDDILRAAP